MIFKLYILPIKIFVQSYNNSYFKILNNGQVIGIFYQFLNKIKHVNYIFPERLIKMLFKYITFIHINIMLKKI